MENSKKIYSIIIAIILVIFIGLGIYSFAKKRSVENRKITPSEQISGASENRLFVEDQFPGKTVYISSASLRRAGYVVVQKNEAGKAGAIIGEASFTPGTNPGSVSLSEETREGQEYFVTLYDDTNSDKKFTAADDKILTDDYGRPIVVKIKATTKIVEQKG